MVLEYVDYTTWAPEQSENIHLLFAHSGSHLGI